MHLLSQKKAGVDVIIFTENGHGRKGFLTASEVTDFDNEYPTLTIKPNPDCHDRFIVLDYGLKTEKVYHCGASSKDAGKKVSYRCFPFRFCGDEEYIEFLHNDRGTDLAARFVS